MFLSPITPGAIIAKLKGLVLMSASLISGVILYKKFSEENKQTFRKVLGTFLVFLVFGSVLEIAGILRPVSDFFRSLFYSESLYAGDVRDVALTGHVRPKLFTSEPSHLTKGFMVICNAWYLLKPSNKTFFKALILHLYMFWAEASPIVILSLGILFFSNLLLSKNKIPSIVILVTFLSTAAYIGIKYAEEIQQISALAGRLEKSSSGDDGSVNQRLIYPMFTSVDVIKNYPFFGIGILNKGYSLKVTRYQSVGDPNQLLGNNGFFNFISYFGVFGFFFLFLTFLTYLWNKLSVKKLIIFGAFFIIYNFSTGAFVTPRYWIYSFIIVTCLVITEHEE